MAVFRGTDRIRKILVASRQTFRFIRFKKAQALPVSNKQTQPIPTNFYRKYRKPIAYALCGLVAATVIGILGRQYVQAHSVDYYSVTINGETAGNISAKEKVEELLAAKAEELENAETTVHLVLNDNQVTYSAERAYKKKVDDEETLVRLEGMLQTHAVGVKLIVNGEEVGIVRDEMAAKKLLQRVKNKYVPARLVAKKAATEVRSLSLTAGASDAATAEAKPQRIVTSVEFAEKVEMVDSQIDAAQLSDPDELFAKLTEGEPIPRTYTVQKGDCIGCIAAKMDVTEELIHQNNTWIKGDRITVGDVLDLSESEPPILNVNSEEEVTEIEEIEPPIEYEKSDSMKLGQQKVLQEGTPGKQQVTYRLLKRNGSLIEEEQVSVNVLEAPIATRILRGTKVIRGEGSGKFSWPVVGARITSYQGQRWGRMHKGIDIIGKSNILAADEGVVEFAGYKSGGLGNSVTINHQNGFKTVYGHMKSVKVKKGQIVEKGDIIGVMGSTGHSTGTHLHFEVYLNSNLKNPTSYLK
ncbi:peptidoglycan DD-metalloendopeptidase family protein [Cohnella terricola]|uniref:Peptidoglycan DD-metalloendopeptidase family protein n=1 Tax=Cohnella terricola TaxID=1289167 RepID=A0A559JJ81_9BACL|nr:peptidoglycan DD-metalloendopeptidase family protein [Cohnella terricola]TVX99930.1 peptidoglycan DD-metalloendopeptidase family protein [Cohnella terricola]